MEEGKSCHYLSAPHPRLCLHARIDSSLTNIYMCVYKYIHTTNTQTHTQSHIENSMFLNTQTPMFFRPEIFDIFNDSIDQKYQQEITTKLETRTQ